MAKIITNTTGSAIVLSRVGLRIAAGASYTIEPQEYTLWASSPVLAQVTPYINLGSLVINDGIQNLAAADAINFLEYPDTAFNARFLSEPERANGFVSKTVQEAIEEAAGSSGFLAPTTTVGAVTAVAYATTLADNTTYQFDARVVARRTDVSGDTGMFQLMVRVKRQGGGAATLVGHQLQKVALRDDAGMEIDWDVSGNQVQLKVTGVAAKTIDWQPQIEQLRVS